MIVRAVAEILEDVTAGRERRLADPIRALAAHMRVALGRAVHPLRHEMAANAGIGAHALRHAGRGVMWATRAEIRDAHRCIFRIGQHRLCLFQPAYALFEFFVAMIAQDARADRDGDVVRIECGLDREKPVRVLVLFADDHRLVRCAVELFPHLHFDERALLLDDNDHVEAAREFHEAARLERPGTSDFVEANAEIVRLHLIDAEIIPRLTHVEIGFADRDDADLGVRSA